MNRIVLIGNAKYYPPFISFNSILISNNRNTKSANPRLVSKYYLAYKEHRYAIDQIRRRKNEHARAIKNVLSIPEDSKRTEQLRRHRNIGVCFKNDLKRYEAHLKKIEYSLMNEALKLPNKTHPDTTIGEEKRSEIMFVKGQKPEFNFKPKTHLEIGEKYNLFDFENGAKLTG